MLGRFWVIIGVGVGKVLGNNRCRFWVKIGVSVGKVLGNNRCRCYEGFG